MADEFAGLPTTIQEFDERFATEKACWDFLFATRWPQGFHCPKCDGPGGWTLRDRGMVECKSCGRQTSVTAGTILDRTRKPLRLWFKAMWWICSQKTGGSAKGLQRLLGLRSYETAWTWLHKLRVAMIRAQRDPLEGPVEVDDAFIGGSESEAEAVGRPIVTKMPIVVAVEIPVKGKRSMGRIRIRHVSDFSSQSLVPFIRENVRPDSRVITDGWHGYWPLRHEPYVHEQQKGANEALPHVHLVISLLKRWLLGTHQGAVRSQRLQAYLEEFAFRFNRRKSSHVGKIFYRMVQGIVRSKPQHIVAT